MIGRNFIIKGSKNIQGPRNIAPKELLDSHMCTPIFYRDVFHELQWFACCEHMNLKKFQTHDELLVLH